jgi:hypothetical protein
MPTQPKSELPEHSADPTSDLPLYPLHDLPGRERRRLAVIRGKGRPRAIAPAPTADQEEYHRRLAEEQDRAIETDRVVQVLGDPSHVDAIEVLQVLVEQVAREVAALRFDRIRGAAKGQDIGQVASRIVDGYFKLARLLLERHHLGLDEFETRSMAKIQAFWLETIAEVARESLPPASVSTFLERLKSLMEGWQSSLDSEDPTGH